MFYTSGEGAPHLTERIIGENAIERICIVSSRNPNVYADEMHTANDCNIWCNLIISMMHPDLCKLQLLNGNKLPLKSSTCYKETLCISRLNIAGPKSGSSNVYQAIKYINLTHCML